MKDDEKDPENPTGFYTYDDGTGLSQEEREQLGGYKQRNENTLNSLGKNISPFEAPLYDYLDPSEEKISFLMGMLRFNVSDKLVIKEKK